MDSVALVNIRNSMTTQTILVSANAGTRRPREPGTLGSSSGRQPGKYTGGKGDGGTQTRETEMSPEGLKIDPQSYLKSSPREVQNRPQEGPKSSPGCSRGLWGPLGGLLGGQVGVGAFFYRFWSPCWVHVGGQKWSNMEVKQACKTHMCSKRLLEVSWGRF